MATRAALRPTPVAHARGVPILGAMELTTRQAELADVALGIVGHDGMAAVTFRSVALASGWSLGAVQKAFSSKEELLRAMFARLREASGAVPPGEPGRPTLAGWLTDLMLGMLPLDDRRRTLTLQGSAFSERAAFDAATGEAIRASDDEIRGLLAQLVRRAKVEGEVAGEVEADQVAWAYLALAQGFAAQLLYDPRPENEVCERVALVVAGLLPFPTPAG